MARFSDEKLQQFYEEFETHKMDFEEYRLEQDRIHTEFLQAIRDNTHAVADLARRASGIIEVWEASQGAVKVLNWVSKGVKWIAGIGIAVSGIWLFLKTGQWK